jgi:CDP-2,3-bis-(O-geranylgeranyl)-sn-glycerol synthase
MRLVELVYLMLPAYFANMAAPFSKFWPGWNAPISRRWLGDHKTVVGFGLGIVAGVLVAYAQSRSALPIARWPPSEWLVVGLAQGTGAMSGDAAKSFVKRRLGIAPGRAWIPADQLDFVVGALLLARPWLSWLHFTDVLLILAFTFVADIAVNHISFRLGIRDARW